MKKLLSAFCFLLLTHCIAQAPFDVRITTGSKSSGERVLVKALTAYVNRDGHKKAPMKRATIPSSEWPKL